jgi:hypothetical protein
VIFVIETSAATILLSRIGVLFTEQRLDINRLYLHAEVDGRGTITLHCDLEHDRVRYIAQRLRALQGLQK